MTDFRNHPPPFRNAWDALRRSRHPRTQAARRWILKFIHGRHRSAAIDSLDIEWRRRLPFELDHRFWELYVAAAAIEDGLQLSPIRTLGQADLVYVANSVRCHIECVATTPGVESNPDHVLRPAPGIAEQVPVKEIELRILSVLSEKIKQMQRRIERGVILPDEQYYIALNISGATRMRGDSEPPFVVRAAFGIGDIAVPFERDTMHSRPPIVWTQDELTRSSGAIVPKGAFASAINAPKQLSGILFAHVDAFNHPGLADQPLSSAFSYVPNPFVSKPVPHPPMHAVSYLAQVEADAVVGYRRVLARR